MNMRSCNGGWHGHAGWGRFRRFQETAIGLWADDGANSVSDAGSSLAASDLHLAELRSVSEIPGANGFPRLLAAEARRSPLLGDGGAFQTDQARGAARGGRGVQVELTAWMGSKDLLPLVKGRRSYDSEIRASFRLQNKETGGKPWPDER